MNYSIGKEAYLQGQVILVDKPLTWTSFDVVKKIRVTIERAYDFKKLKVGHAGTLDPLATGLVIVCTGKATKRINEIQEESKVYEATITLGATTPSYDLETEIDHEFPFEHITIDNVKKVLKEEFLGTIDQIPPIYSAKHIKGKRAYELARKGKNIEMKANPIVIYDIRLVEFNLPDISLYINCSKGTYIRSLARDIGKALGSGAYLKELKRIAIGKYRINEAVTIPEFEKILEKQNKTEL